MNQNLLKNNLQKYRLIVITIFTFFTLVLLDSMFNINFISNFSENTNRYYSTEIYMVVGFMLSLGLFLNIYLSEDKSDQVIKNIHVENNNISDDKINKLISNSQKKIEQKLEQLELELLRKPGDSFSKNQNNELIKTLKQQFLKVSSEELLNDLKEKTKKIIDNGTTQRLETHFSRTINRLSTEIRGLEKRSRVNLIIGSLTAFSGVSIFILFVFEKVDITSAETYLVTELAPRISLVIVIELFAYFFLGLYKSNLSEIKHFHNELTNVEHKYMALEEALASANEETVIEIVKGLAKTERNFLLKKGETTVSLEDRRYTYEEQSGIVNALVNKLSKIK